MITANTSINIQTIGIIITAILGIATFLKVIKKDSASDLKEQMEVSVKLDTICNTTNETRSDIKSLNNQINELAKEQALLKQSDKTMWERIDEHNDKLNEHEDRLSLLEKGENINEKNKLE